MKGYVHIYTGDGKGKTTAAIGLAVRACGAGLRVFIGQFIKGRDSGEIGLLNARCPGITIEQFGLGGFVRGKPSKADIAAARAGLERLRDVLRGGAHDMVIADEINGAVHAGALGVDDVLSLLDMRSPSVELVLTGRDADARLTRRADLVTEMRKKKHYFDDGVQARKGIEY